MCKEMYRRLLFVKHSISKLDVLIINYLRISLPVDINCFWYNDEKSYFISKI